ncbi:MAG: hypothetical protein M1815_000521 [Lichina confinis]|nr:MAG: hypothetical protein M1815_000521 [Lichina confinis]
MSWLFGGSSTTAAKPQVKISTDGTPEAPSRDARQRCWDSRDAFFGCLTRHDIVDSIKDDSLAQQHCGVEHRGFEQNCVSTWVEYFKRRRVMEHQRAQMIAKIEAENAKSEQEKKSSSSASSR